jgi:hypothetical protein
VRPGGGPTLCKRRVVGALLAFTASGAVTLATGSGASAQKSFCDWLADRVVPAKTEADARFYLARGEDWGCW